MLFKCKRSSGNNDKPYGRCEFVREHIFGKEWNIEINSVEDILQIVKDTKCELAIYESEQGNMTMEIVDDYR